MVLIRTNILILAGWLAGVALTTGCGLMDLVQAEKKLYKTYTLTQSWSSYAKYGYATSLALDSQGNFYLADAGSDKIKKISPQGVVVWQSQLVTAEGEIFGSPLGVALDADNNVYALYSYRAYSSAEAQSPVVINSNNQAGYSYKYNIQKFDASGNFLAKWGDAQGVPAQIYGGNTLAVNASGEVFVADFSSAEVKVYDSAGNFLASWNSWQAGTESFSSPRWLAVDQDDKIYVYDSGQAKIIRFNSRGGYDSELTLGSQGTIFSLAVDGGGNLVFLEYKSGSGTRIRINSWGGENIAVWGVSSVSAIAADAGQNVYAASSGGLKKFSPD